SYRSGRGGGSHSYCRFNVGFRPRYPPIRVGVLAQILLQVAPLEVAAMEKGLPLAGAVAKYQPGAFLQVKRPDHFAAGLRAHIQMSSLHGESELNTWSVSES